MKRNTIAAVDVGTSKVCTVIADMEGGNFLRIVGVGVVPTRGLQKGLVVNLSEAGESVRESVRIAEQMAGCRLYSACIGVTGRHINSITNRGVIAVTHTDRLVRPEDLRRVLQVASSTQVPGDRKLFARDTSQIRRRRNRGGTEPGWHARLPP